MGRAPGQCICLAYQVLMFEVLTSAGDPGEDIDVMELRRFAPMVLAQVTVEASSREEEWSGALQRQAIWGSTR